MLYAGAAKAVKGEREVFQAEKTYKSAEAQENSGLKEVQY